MDAVMFTKFITQLLMDMQLKGERPIATDLKRSDDEQMRLFRVGRAFDADGNIVATSSAIVTKCDGVKKMSSHQRNAALDIYFQSEEGTKPRLVRPKKGYKYWHKRWEGFGGKPAIRGDKGHFEG